jgi:hypothetical protein
VLDGTESLTRRPGTGCAGDLATETLSTYGRTAGTLATGTSAAEVPRPEALILRPEPLIPRSRTPTLRPVALTVRTRTLTLWPEARRLAGRPETRPLAGRPEAGRLAGRPETLSLR